MKSILPASVRGLLRAYAPCAGWMALSLACATPAAALETGFPRDGAFAADTTRKPASADAAGPDSLPAASGAAAEAAGEAEPDSGGRKLYTYISYPFLQMITLPVEVILVPVVKLALYPAKPPLRYMLNENVIDRTIKLISFGDEGAIMLYPTMNLAPGTGSSTGLTLRDQALFGLQGQRGVVQGTFFVNGDWKLRAYVTSSDIAGTGFNSKVSLSLVRWKNNSFNMPGTPAFWSFGDTSTSVSGALSHLVFEKFALRGQYTFRTNHYGSSPTKNDSTRADFLRGPDGSADERSRGLQSEWIDQNVTIGLMRDTRENQNIVLGGSNLSLLWGYHFTDAGHDYHGWSGTLSNYFKLGKERYEISRDEERKSGEMSVKKILKKMDLENLKKGLFNRKVLATQIYAAQSYEVEGNRMPVYGLQTLGNDTPMRGYSGSRFRHYTVLSTSLEYRFPIMRLVDGVIFDEYGVAGRSWDTIDYWEDLKNSWGFGIRVRRPDIYLFRLQVGFHGAHGLQLNLSVDEPF